MRNVRVAVSPRLRLCKLTAKVCGVAAIACLCIGTFRRGSSVMLPRSVLREPHFQNPLVGSTVLAEVELESNENNENNQRFRAAAEALEAYRHPTVFFPNVSIDNPVRVFYHSLFPKMINDDAAQHFVLDGIRHSPFLQLISEQEGGHKYCCNEDSTNIVWLVSTSNIWPKPGFWCHRLDDSIHEAQNLRRNHSKAATPTSSTTSPLYWPIHLLNWVDEHTTYPCHRAFLSTPPTFYYHKRSVVRDRHWNSTTNQTEPGHVQNYGNNWTHFSAAPVHHIPFCVRSDLVQALENLTRTEFNYSSQLPFVDWNIESASSWNRSIDVAHFWPARGPGVDRGKYEPLSQLRDTVSLTLEERMQQQYVVFAGLAGEAQHNGRSTVHMEYPRRLLQSKIVVVAQKDVWEDHYRLMEALVSGAMVLSDVMLTLPQGLEDGKSLRFYHNQSHLCDLVDYYLQHDSGRVRIAREGRQVAMRRHRSWHRMEEVVFGRILSVDKVE